MSDNDVIMLKKDYWVNKNDRTWKFDRGELVYINDLLPRDLAIMLNTGVATKRDGCYLTITLDAFEIAILMIALRNYYNDLSVSWRGDDQLWLKSRINFDRYSKERHKEAVLKRRKIDMVHNLIHDMELKKDEADGRDIK